MKMKKFMVAALAAAITAGSVMSASAAWVESGSDWKYQNTDGSWQTNTWFQDGGKSYHFDANGNVQKGWFKDANGKWFFFSYNGVMQTGLIKVDEKVYFMNDDGSLFVGTKEINKVEYNFTEYGTTNGKPSVGLSQTWGGNGNQSGVVKGGGGWSSSSGSSSGGRDVTTPTVKEQAKADIESAVKAVFEDVSEVAKAKITGTVITVTELEEDATAEDLVGYAEDTLTKILKNENVLSVTLGNHTYSKEDINDLDLVSKLDAIGYLDKTADELLQIAKEKKLTVELTEGSLNYTIK